MNIDFWNSISTVEDPRVQGRIDYPLSLILLTSFYAILSGCDDCE